MTTYLHAADPVDNMQRMRFFVLNMSTKPAAPTTVGKIVVSEETLERVRQAMPSQPWPIGAHFAVAERLGLQTSEVRRALSELMRRNVFHHQFDGGVYVPERSSQQTTSVGSTVA